MQSRFLGFLWLPSAALEPPEQNYSNLYRDFPVKVVLPSLFGVGRRFFAPQMARGFVGLEGKQWIARRWDAIGGMLSLCSAERRFSVPAREVDTAPRAAAGQGLTHGTVRREAVLTAASTARGWIGLGTPLVVLKQSATIGRRRGLSPCHFTP